MPKLKQNNSKETLLENLQSSDNFHIDQKNKEQPADAAKIPEKSTDGQVKKTKEDVTTEIAQLYFKEIGFSPLLNAKDEYDLSINTQRGNQEARKQLIESNLRLVVKIARHYIPSSNIDFLDLIEEGNLGLMRAVEKFKPELGYRFSTYATFWINHFIGRAIKNQSRIIRLPIHIDAELNVYNRTARALAKDLEREPTSQEIANVLEQTPEKINKLSILQQKTSSLDAPIFTDESSATLSDSIVDQNNPDPSVILHETKTKELIGAWLQKLEPTPREVIKRRFGLDDYEKQTFEQIGKELGIHHEKARHIHINALKKLRQFMKGYNDQDILD